MRACGARMNAANNGKLTLTLQEFQGCNQRPQRILDIHLLLAVHRDQKVTSRSKSEDSSLHSVDVCS
jgi:hypothetical protein